VDLRINGQQLTVPETILTIKDLIHHFKLENRTIMVERNQVILRREDHVKTTVLDGDTIELVQFVGGG
jgi:sulfur carrier protein